MNPTSSQLSRIDPTSFRPGILNRDILSVTDVEVLKSHGALLEALDQQQISPETPEQSAFVEVCRGTREPTTGIERTWAKLKARRKFERDEWVGPASENARKALFNTFARNEDWWSNPNRE